MPYLAAATLIAWVLAGLAAVQSLRGPGVIRRLRRMVSALFWALWGVLLGSVFVLLHTFHAFSGQTLVAYATATRRPSGGFELYYKPAAEAAGVRLPIAGDQWTVSGGMVKWHPWLTAGGWKSYHRPMRLSGQYSDIAQQRLHLPTVHALQHPLQDKFWEAMYWMDPYLSFVEAVYGSSAYAYVEPGVVQEVYVTASGYMIKHSRLKEIPVTASPD